MEKRPKIAAIATIYHKYSHTQHIVDRFLEGYGWNSRHHCPPMDLVSLFVEQVKDNDLSQDRLERFPTMKGYPTIAEALTLGGEELAVDGVLIIGEHGEYPTNEKGQRLYPRYEHFMQMAEVYEKSGRGVPTYSMINISRGIGTGRVKCTTSLKTWVSLLWRDPRYRLRGARLLLI